MKDKEFTRVVETYRDMLFHIALNYLKNSASAEDVVQDVLMQYYQTETEFESEEHLRSWLIRVGINRCKKVLRSPWERRTLPLEDYLQQQSFDDSEQRELLELVMGLPRKYRLVIYLYYYQGYATREIAELLELRETTVQTQLDRGRKKLKTMLTQNGKDEQYAES